MRHIFTLSALTALLSLFSVTASAYDIAVENEGVTIYYNYTADGTELEVTGYFGSSERVVIPEEVIYSGKTYSVTSIGQKAFSNCSALTSVTLPNSVTSIGRYAFYNCSGLTSVTIGNSVTTIEDYAFDACSGLKKVIVKDIAAWCKIIFGDNPLIYAHHLYSDENTEITNLVIPNSVKSIGKHAFSGCSGLTSVTIPNSVTSIGDGAFSGCSDLTSVTIPNSVTSIGNAAFWYCSGLTSITIPNSVTSIGGDTFHMCTSLTSVTIPNSVTSIGGLAFSSCTGLTSVTIPNSVTSIGDGAFEDCTDLKKVIVKDIAAWCNISFGISTSNPLYYAHHLYSDENTEITDLVIPNSVTSIGNNAFSGCKGLTSVTIPNSVTTIGYFAFEGCTSLTSVTIPNGVTSIEGCAFSGCTGLTSVTIPNSVTSIGDYAFSGCTDLKKVIVKDIAAWCNISFGISDSNPLYYAHHLYSDENTEITDLVIPDSVTRICSFTFSGCSGITSVTIPNSVNDFGYYAFEGCTGLKKVIVKDIAAWCNISFGDIDSNPLYHAHHLYSDENTEITDLVIPDNVTIIRRHAFYGCSGLTSVTIPNSVKTIGDYAFKDCTGLKKVIVNDIAAWCNIIFGVNITNPLYYAHHLYSDENTEITDLVIPDNVTIIRRHAFYGCSGLTSVIIPNSVRSIGGYAFYCDNLTTVKSYIETPSAINGKTQSSPTFHLNAFNKATLYVPAGTIEKYKATEGWKDFASIEEFTYNPYDLNDDTKISTADIQVIINDMKKPQAVQDLDHDLNGDGKISTADIQVIINEMKK